MKLFKSLLLAAITLSLAACSKGSTTGGEDPVKPQPPTEKLPITLSIGITTRATDNSFENGDEIGLYMVNYNGSTPGTLANSGNYLNNSKFTFNGTWNSTTPLYWKDNTTHADFYVYYPFGNPDNVYGYTFNVQTDQSAEANYKKSDFIWGKKGNVTPTSSNVNIQTSHILSCAVIKITAGEGISNEELAQGNLTVRINSIKPTATINLANGDVQATGAASSITPLKTDGEYRAIIAPQEVAECNLVTIYLNGQEFNFKKGFSFQKGKKHSFTITLAKTGSGLNVEISDWDQDDTDNGGIAE